MAIMRHLLKFLPLLSCAVCYTRANGSEKEYGVVLDVGSTATKVRVFAWEGGKSIPDVEAIFSKRIKPGFSSLIRNESGIEPYLTQLLALAKNHVPSSKHSHTLVYFLATAGMRQLLAPAADRMMTTVAQLLWDPEVNPFRFRAQNARILSGEEEGAFAWIAVNYNKGFFRADVSECFTDKGQKHFVSESGESEAVSMMGYIHNLRSCFRECNDHPKCVAILWDASASPYENTRCWFSFDEREIASANLTDWEFGKMYTKNKGCAVPKQVGVLELGGASTQIAFVPDTDPLQDKFVVHLGGEVHSLYVHSYLNYGQTATTVWITKMLLGNLESLGLDPNATELPYPCGLKGDRQPIDIDGTEYILKGGERIGVGDDQIEDCEYFLDEYVYSVQPRYCAPAPCAIGPYYQPTIPKDMDFYAIAGFYNPVPIFGIGDENGRVQPQEYFNAGKQYCKKSLDEVLSETNATEEFASSRCLIGLYGGKLMMKAFKFAPDTDQIIFTNKIEGRPVNWALGAILFEEASDMALRGESHITKSSPLLITVLLTLVIKY